MRNNPLKTLVLSALAATTFGANAENTYDYFVGFDAGTHIGGKAKLMTSKFEDEGFYSGSTDTDPSLIAGLSGGAIINDHHRVRISLAYDALEIEGYDRAVDRTDLSANYDYMIPLANKLNWTVGAHMGYEFFVDKHDWDNAAGFTFGVQTGLDYRLTKHWSLGAEIAFTAHDYFKDGYMDSSGELWNSDFKIEDDVTFMANVQYHF
ncbi:hypothetical protein GCM10007938_13400 [Vibrio zhanjiangensis]|uniref:Outer membrane protein beta-barrel domain-containing protein n=1 Tax=Vibrio zhanjiangensis TaxID=1046128 RepID=A0ABQ6EYJ2_9VIBR|nr:outer membrane beta-barrel protein [Vibrio zhanjiangensis]GLT17562.1 hypothetical protein GCM10007938_13400 [Vibrio zhanjiangensis]